MAKTLSHFTTIDISDLPGNAKQEIMDFYKYLLTKYSIRKDKKKDNRKLGFLKNVEKQRFHLASDYIFNRDDANER